MKTLMTILQRLLEHRLVGLTAGFVWVVLHPFNRCIGPDATCWPTCCTWLPTAHCPAVCRLRVDYLFLVTWWDVDDVVKRRTRGIQERPTAIINLMTAVTVTLTARYLMAIRGGSGSRSGLVYGRYVLQPELRTAHIVPDLRRCRLCTSHTILACLPGDMALYCGPAGGTTVIRIA